jgi:hypothetical protein
VKLTKDSSEAELMDERDCYSSGRRGPRNPSHGAEHGRKVSAGMKRYWARKRGEPSVNFDELRRLLNEAHYKSGSPDMYGPLAVYQKLSSTFGRKLSTIGRDGRMREPRTEAGRALLGQAGISDYVLPEDILAIEAQAAALDVERLAAAMERAGVSPHSVEDFPDGDKGVVYLGRAKRILAAYLYDRAEVIADRLEQLERVAEAARAMFAAEKVYQDRLDMPRPDPLPDLSDPVVEAEWFGPFDRVQEARRIFAAALAQLDGEKGESR